MFGRAFSEVINFGQSLDVPLVGEAYLNSTQKRLLDRYGARILLPTLAPLAAMARLAVLMEDGSPSAITIPRVGKGGIIFDQDKVRSMVKESSVDTFTPLKDKNDSRVTKVGKVIRKFSIDEIPQLHNVKKGEMSLVGPRPKTPIEFLYYCNLDPEFEAPYTSCYPGLTGLEQIGGRGNLEVQERIELVKQYAEEACLALDLDILQKTAGAIYSRNGAY